METFVASLVAALAAGAIAAAKDTATQAVKGAYAGICKYITDRYATVQLDALEKNPQSKGQKLVVQEALKEAGADNDPELPALAASFVEILKSQASDAAKVAGVVLEDISAGIDVQIRRIAAGTTARNLKAGSGSVIIEDIGNQTKN
jgi:hypothetical protein